MYNFLMSADDSSWNGKPVLFDEDRCSFYIRNEQGDISQLSVSEIKKFPCFFTYEEGCKKDPKFGRICDITIRQKTVKIDYEIVELDSFISYTDIPDMLFDLGIHHGRWALSRTRFEVKNVDLAKALALKNIGLPLQFMRSETKVDITKHHFDVAFSFPGEVRDYVKAIADELKKIVEPNTYFYDNNFKAQLARPSLDILLQDIYRNRSKMVIVFYVKNFKKKNGVVLSSEP